MIENPFKEIQVGTTKDIPSDVKTEQIELTLEQQSVRGDIMFWIAQGRIDRVLEIKKKFNLPDEVFQEMAAGGIESLIRNKQIDTALKIKRSLKMSDEVFQEAAKKGIVYQVKIGGIDTALKMKRKLKMSEGAFQGAVKEGIVPWLKNGDVDTVLKMKRKLKMSDEAFQEAAKEGIKYLLNGGNIDAALKIKEKFKIADEFFFLPEVQEAAREGIKHLLNGGNIDAALKIKERLNVSDIDIFDELESVKKSNLEKGNPYENHEWLMGVDKARESSALSSLLCRREEDIRTAMGITNTQEEGEISDEQIAVLTERIKRIQEIIQEEWVRFAEDIAQSIHIAELEKRVLVPNDTRTGPTLWRAINGLVSRFIVLEYAGVKGLINNLREQELIEVIRDGMNAFLKVYEMDIPLYDKLYEEFDDARVGQNRPMEVYLGRDGVYAWTGRKIQDIARWHRMDPKVKERIRAEGNILEIRPKYIVYPRYIKNNVPYIVKRAYLEQEQISIDQNPMFFDTGYTGSIPEDIMKVMGFKPKEIESRIRLLSTDTADRRVRGVPKNMRTGILEYIENNAKGEHGAEGLWLNPKTGKIEHIAEPTRPKEQFRYQMVRQALMRHYWFVENNR
ncbi:MAG: hypothetical protein A3F94_02215 [Candidatus Spechtbacteria bacterium RIFCSPLOWO2_12_FULL_38_22]|uniref:Uncharacterized protein n=1 Tax=Candidatus Spechtbacteria bacterium RIFCSPLOWO2_12_FULL_38_22 TaxID=1802165 RepID=A0A1G2HG63_9BACT|nr:MAG: hypothetical protein A3E58_02565 [Candidatus Spechtbacteria bacterium RIFCSPHIGHO2_12_FULL_38_30]OGZ60511.1 MAG: hypothetical protein A3A00_01155 [Candidatus Spechtbacteria bacterium RIFCSPLOWO2_01_FULL_38_20]OGZ61359.1 MAG: hypothetical protein A3F94_02215 [Candidatus Spechtbacteria bacterium RIFCSPLOWO2_12_FULL_38_22]